MVRRTAKIKYIKVENKQSNQLQHKLNVNYKGDTEGYMAIGEK